MSELSKTYSPAEIAQHLGVKADTVRAWIKQGAIVAIDVSSDLMRPRWRITSQSLAAFEQGRATVQPKPVRKKAKTKKRTLKITKFF